MCGRVSASLFDLQGSSGLIMGWNPRSGSWTSLTEPALCTIQKDRQLTGSWV